MKSNLDLERNLWLLPLAPLAFEAHGTTPGNQAGPAERVRADPCLSHGRKLEP